MQRLAEKYEQQDTPSPIKKMPSDQLFSLQNQRQRLPDDRESHLVLRVPLPPSEADRL
jgi:hypothetical protein